MTELESPPIAGLRQPPRCDKRTLGLGFRVAKPPGPRPVFCNSCQGRVDANLFDRGLSQSTPAEAGRGYSLRPSNLPRSDRPRQERVLQHRRKISASSPASALPHDPGLDPILADSRLSPTAKLIVVALVKHWAWVRDHAWPSDRTIAGKVGRSPGHVQRCLRELEAAGWIRRERTDAVRSGRRIWLTWRCTDGMGAVWPGAVRSDPQRQCAVKES